MDRPRLHFSCFHFVIRLTCLLLLSGTAWANDTFAPNDPELCLTCHGKNSPSPVTGILHTVHAQKADPRTPFAQTHACQSCHGPSQQHLQRDAHGKLGKPAITFNDKTPVTKQNEACLGCHQKGELIQWHGSRHDFEGLSCASCHQSHSSKDPMFGLQQKDRCLDCHAAQRSQLMQLSAHPIDEGIMRCSDCHNTHGGQGEPLLSKGSVNETCFSCHSEKRGPFLWEHAPVREDCSQCHRAHGSNHPSLLAARQPWLCQQCHMAAFHPSTAFSGTGLPGANPSQSLLAQGCTNCHAQVHGSNHPSGLRQTR